MDGGPLDGRWVTPRLSITEARAAYIGPGLKLAPHRNAVATIAIALSHPFSLTVFHHGQPGAFEQKSIALIPPGQQHHLVTDGAMAFLYLDAVSDDHHALRTVDLEAGRARLLSDVEASLVNADSLARTLGVPARNVPDPRLVPLIRQIDQAPEALETVASAAAMVSLSPSRFQALFRQATGLPFRRYRLWRRMARVVALLGDGQSLTAAAHEAGFASSAHLSAAFKDMFGLTPSEILPMIAAQAADSQP